MENSIFILFYFFIWYYAFQFGTKKWPAKLTGVTCFQITLTRKQVTQGQFLWVEF